MCILVQIILFSLSLCLIHFLYSSSLTQFSSSFSTFICLILIHVYSPSLYSLLLLLILCQFPSLHSSSEILRSMLYRGSDTIRDIEWVIFDEVHCTYGRTTLHYTAVFCFALLPHTSHCIYSYMHTKLSRSCTVTSIYSANTFFSIILFYL